MLTYKEAVQKVLDKIGEKYTITLDDKYGLDWNWINFRIKECRGWLFGAWCNGEKSLEEQTVHYFCQYENEINKFKPSYSVIAKDLIVDENFICHEDYMMNSIEFIHKHPIRAWHEDYYEDMCRCKYVNGFMILKDWIKYKFDKGKSEKIKALCDRLAIRFVKKNIIPDIKDYLTAFDYECKDVYIEAQGEGIYPKYDIVALVGNLDKKFKGYYSWIKRDNIDKFILRTKKLARCFGVYWSIPFDNNFFMTGEHHAGSKV